MQRVERLTNSSDVKVENILFGKVEVGKVPGTNMSYKRIPITITHRGGLYGPLFIKTEQCFSFGVQENVSPDTGKVNGWTLPIVMYNKDGATEKQLKWVEKFNEIIARCKDYVIENKEEVDRYDLERSQLNKIGGCMWWPKNEGIVDEKRGPTLYPKLIAGKSQAQKRYDTKFRVVSDLLDRSDVGVDIGKEELIEHCNVIAVIKIESIYIGGGKISLQVRVSEALVKIQRREVGNFLRPVAIEAHTEVAKLFKE